MNSQGPIQFRQILTERRQALKLSMHDVARRASMEDTTYWRIETGRSATPQVDNAMAIAKALDMSCTDMFATLGWLPADELPSISPYLQAKYGQLPPEAFHRIEGYLVAQCELYGVSFEYPSDS
ncbi:helix-turn-helix domain-containing protein [Nocardia sp. NPDC051052]|uniref:helix-turn-helix domain-containing protein n=1 Tax=Nocardia sp. NPDC051052 TaxID=3364322 RepID=UPI00378CFEDE